MELNIQGEPLINVVRALRAEEAEKVQNWAHQLADPASERAIEWSDSWTGQDIAGATAASMQRFEEREIEER